MAGRLTLQKHLHPLAHSPTPNRCVFGATCTSRSCFLSFSRFGLSGPFLRVAARRISHRIHRAARNQCVDTARPLRAKFGSNQHSRIQLRSQTRRAQRLVHTECACVASSSGAASGRGAPSDVTSVPRTLRARSRRCFACVKSDVGVRV